MFESAALFFDHLAKPHNRLCQIRMLGALDANWRIPQRSSSMSKAMLFASNCHLLAIQLRHRSLSVPVRRALGSFWIALVGLQPLQRGHFCVEVGNRTGSGYLLDLIAKRRECGSWLPFLPPLRGFCPFPQLAIKSKSPPCLAGD